MLVKNQTPKGKALGADHTKGVREGKKEGADTDDFTPTGRLAGGEFALLAARFAALGHTLHQAPTGADFMVTRWGHNRYLANIHEARRFLVQIGCKL